MPTSGEGQQQQVPMSRSTPNLQQLVNSLYLRDEPAWGVPAVLNAGHNTSHHPQQQQQQHHSPLQQLQQPAAPSRSESVTSLPASSSSGLSSWGSIQDASKAGEFNFLGFFASPDLHERVEKAFEASRTQIDKLHAIISTQRS
jgi:hypothetical protein